MTKQTEAKVYRSPIAASVHEMMQGFHEAGEIPATTMRSFDASCLAPAEALAADDIRELRQRERVSQPVFAAYLNVSRNLVSDWERGVKRPGGPALRLLAIVRRRGLQALM